MKRSWLMVWLILSLLIGVLVADDGLLRSRLKKEQEYSARITQNFKDVLEDFRSEQDVAHAYFDLFCLHTTEGKQVDLCQQPYPIPYNDPRSAP